MLTLFEGFYTLHRLGGTHAHHTATPSCPQDSRCGRDRRGRADVSGLLVREERRRSTSHRHYACGRGPERAHTATRPRGPRGPVDGRMQHRQRRHPWPGRRRVEHHVHSPHDRHDGLRRERREEVHRPGRVRARRRRHQRAHRPARFHRTRNNHGSRTVDTDHREHRRRQQAHHRWHH